jgi:TRAP-type C4-dicarboxylate transport system permease small subunit
MFGSALAYLQDRHIRFTILTDFFSPRLRQRTFAIVDLVMVGVGGLLAYSGWLFVLKRGRVEASGIIGSAKDLAAATGRPWLEALGHMATWQFSLTLGGVILAFAASLKFFERTGWLRRHEV